MASVFSEQNSFNSVNLNKKFNEIVRSNGITDTVSEVIINDAGLKGEGLNSLHKLAVLTFENKERSPLNLFVKMRLPISPHTEMLEEMKVFEKEARFFSEYVPAAKEMCRRQGRDNFIDFYPKCYFADETMILLENLESYEMIDKAVLQDLHAANLSITTLAKHHAIGHIMIQESGGSDKFFKRFSHLDYEAYDKPLMKSVWSSAFDYIIKANVNFLKSSDVPGAKEAASKLKSNIGKPLTLIMNTLSATNESKFFVFNHGDYWNNNMMFQRNKETNKLVHHVAIDFQMTRYNNLATDLGYFLYTSVQWKVRQNNLNELLRLYTDTLNRVTEDFGHPTNFKFEDVLMEYRKRVGFGFWIGMTMAVGPGMAAFKDVDVCAIDTTDWVKILDNFMITWRKENPEKAKEMAEQLVSLMNEYESLTLNEVE